MELCGDKRGNSWEETWHKMYAGKRAQNYRDGDIWND